MSSVELTKLTSAKIRNLYIDFFVDRGHKEISPAPLVLKDDLTTLFTGFGMQPLVPYLLGLPHPKGKRLVNSQPSFRGDDILEIGDNRHTTFFEMLGNWSLGDYFKKEQISWFFEFLTDVLGLDAKRLSVSIFEGNKYAARDTESEDIWRKVFAKKGVKPKICFYGVEKNWWSRSGAPDNMPSGEPGGPDTEVFWEFDIPHNREFGEKCHPNCDCGKYLEIGNSVFMQYRKKEDGSLAQLPQRNVDFGGGLERIVAAREDTPDIFKIDLFWPIVEALQKGSGRPYLGNEKQMRVIADHIKASVFIASGGVLPSNKDRGYVLRRLLRRVVVYANQIGLGMGGKSTKGLVETVGKIYEGTDWGEESRKRQAEISQIIDEEERKFGQTLNRGLGIIEKEKETLNEERAFDLFQTYGFPFELTQELLAKFGRNLKKEVFDDKFRRHQELSRQSSAKKFKLQ